MPTDFFFNTGIATYIWLITNKKAPQRKGKVQLINAIELYQKMRKSLGQKKKELSDEQIAQIVDIYASFEESDICKIFKTEDFGYTTVTVEHPLRNESGEIIRDKKKNPKADSDLRDTENIPLSQDITEYFEREVLAFAPDAWLDRTKDKIGYEIPFTKHFYKFTPLRASLDILADLREVETSIASSLAKVVR